MIRVLVVSEAQETIDVIRAALDDAHDMEVTGSAGSVQDALACLALCDVALVSQDLRNDGALQLSRQVRDDSGIKVLVLGLVESAEAVLPYLASGAAGYHAQGHSTEQLLNAIRAAYLGQALISPGITAALIARLAYLAQLCGSAREGELDQRADRLPGLTRREAEILDLMRQGFTNRDIAHRLMIELGTVKNHVHNILRKLNACNRREAVVRSTAL